MVCFHCVAKASCASAIRSAKGFVADVGQAAASKSGGLIKLASRSEHNAERDCHRLMAVEYQLALPVPKSELKTGHGLSLPVLRIRDWMEFLLAGNHTHILVGLKKPHWCREEAILTAFWSNFRQQYPTHPIFEQERLGNLCLNKTFPMIFHGDEGRSRKHLAFLVCNVHSVLGRGLRVESKKRKPPWCKMCPNFHGHTQTSRFMLAALPKVLYTGKNEQTFQDLMRFVADEVRHMFFHGVEDTANNRGRFNMALVHISGDWPWLADCGKFERSFRNVGKSKRQRRRTGICHMCAAGRECDWEQINTLRPQWLQTMFTLQISAENSEQSAFVDVPHCPGQLPNLWQFDIFHTMHLGVCKSFLGSAIAALSEVQSSSRIEDRFESLTQHYLHWCKTERKRPWVSKLCKEHIGWIAKTTYPVGGWHKGSLSTSLMEWFEAIYKAEGRSWPPMLQEAGQACVACNSFLKRLYDAEAWLSASNAREIAALGLEFLVLYARLARAALLQDRLLWALQPKHHSMHHVVCYLHYSANNGKVLSPLCFSTQADEDFIGRPSRVSRRVTPKPLQSCSRVLERYLQSSYVHWVAEGYIVPSSGMAS